MRKDYACLGQKTLWLGGVGMKQVKCPECKKKFMRSPEHVYRRNDKYYCSYTCFRKEYHRKKKAQEDAPSMDAEAAKALVEKCTAKVQMYTERANSTQKGTVQHDSALKCVREWRAEDRMLPVLLWNSHGEAAASLRSAARKESEGMGVLDV